MKTKNADNLSPKSYSKLKRILVVILCYLLSGVGILFMVIVINEEFRKFDWSLLDILAITSLLAWLFHILMSFSWIMDKKLGKTIPLVGTVLALLPFISFPAFDALAKFNFGVNFGFFVSLLAGLTQMLFFLPAIILAIYLVKYHLTVEQ